MINKEYIEVGKGQWKVTCSEDKVIYDNNTNTNFNSNFILFPKNYDTSNLIEVDKVIEVVEEENA